jgi:hypothetical protein
MVKFEDSYVILPTRETNINYHLPSYKRTLELWERELLGDLLVLFLILNLRAILQMGSLRLRGNVLVWHVGYLKLLKYSQQWHVRD